MCLKAGRSSKENWSQSLRHDIRRRPVRRQQREPSTQMQDRTSAGATPAAEVSGEALRVTGWDGAPSWGVRAALLLTSAALLTLEVSWTRFFSYTIWYHFAYLTISVALLGFGSSGAVVAAFPRVFERRGVRLLSTCLVLAAITVLGGLAFLARHPIEIHNLMRAPLHFSASMLVYYAVVGAPFLLAGFSVSVPFAAWPRQMGRLYFWDLVGAAAGCAFVVLLIETLSVPGLIFAAAGLLLASGACLDLASGARTRGRALGAAAVVVLVLAGPAGHRLPVLMTGSKDSSTFRDPTVEPTQHAGADRFTKWTATNRVDAFGWAEPQAFSWWANMGMRSGWQGYRPPVARLTYDGSNGSDIFSMRGNLETEFEFLEHHALRLPYLLLERPNVLVIGVGGGIDLLNAIKHGARHVTGAELQPETVHLLKNTLRDFTSGFYNRDDVTLVASEGRHFVRKTDEVFDLVQITAVDTFAAQATGAYVLAESYLYTVEAMRDYFRRLSPDGIVTTVIGDFIRPGQVPPLATRLALIGVRALQAEGIADPRDHVLVVAAPSPDGGSQNESVLVKKTPFTAAEVATIRAFADENGFRVLYAPGPGTWELSAILGSGEEERLRAIAADSFHVEATHDRDPFFYNVGKWANFTTDSGIYWAMPGSFIGQLVLVLMVVQSTLLGAVLVVVPLLTGARSGLAAPGVLSYLVYFLALGTGFMFLEISFVQTFVLFLGSPTYALSVTIFALLLFSGIGSLVSSRFVDRPQQALRVLLAVLVVLVAAYIAGLAPLFDAMLHLPIAVRIAVAVVAQMPMGLVLGMFMPLGIALVAREHPRLVPWAWGVNGVGSVTGTTLAVLLAMAAGFPAVSVAALAMYLAGTLLLLRAAR
jgi:hypothetical protein